MLQTHVRLFSISSLAPFSYQVLARFGAGTGLAGLGKLPSLAEIPRPPALPRQESAPAASGTDSASTNLALGAQRAADYVNGSYSHTIGMSQTSGGQRPAPPGLSASRPAPPRPLLTGTRPAPSLPSTSKPDTADLKPRAKLQGPSDAAVPERKESLQPPPSDDRDRERSREREKEREREQQRQRMQRELDREKERLDIENEQQVEDQRPVPTAAKSAPANTVPATRLVTPSAATVPNGPPPVKPLQTAKKPTQPGGITAVVEGDDNKTPSSGSVAAAAAALEKPKPKEVEKRISTMTEAQIMEKMRSVVDPGDPKLLYSKIKKIGQGYVICRPQFFGVIHISWHFYTVPLGMCMSPRHLHQARRLQLRRWTSRLNLAKSSS